MAMTIIADVVSPRERGRYQGYFGATFALSSIAGPLLGGVFTDNLSLAVDLLHQPPHRHRGPGRHLGRCSSSRSAARPTGSTSSGAGLMMVGVTAALLVTVWGGTQYPWGSPVIVGLAAGRRSPSSAPSSCGSTTPPSRSCRPSLFRIGVFRTASTVSFLLSMVMFGAIIYLPLYLQLVDGVSAMVSGLLMIPLMLGAAGARRSPRARS